MISEPLAGGTAINIVGGDIDEVLFAEAASSFGARSDRLRQRHRDVGFLAGLDLLSIVLAAVCHDFERLDSHLVAGLPGHVGELVAIGAHVGAPREPR